MVTILFPILQHIDCDGFWRLHVCEHLGKTYFRCLCWTENQKYSSLYLKKSQLELFFLQNLCQLFFLGSNEEKKNALHVHNLLLFLSVGS